MGYFAVASLGIAGITALNVYIAVDARSAFNYASAVFTGLASILFAVLAGGFAARKP